MALEASGLIRNNLKITQANFIKKLSQTLTQQNKKVPANSDLQGLFKRVLAFEKERQKQRR